VYGADRHAGQEVKAEIEAAAENFTGDMLRDKVGSFVDSFTASPRVQGSHIEHVFM
jgi:hypothetical protein